MKHITFCVLSILTVLISVTTTAQTATPPMGSFLNVGPATENSKVLSDTITFTGYGTGVVITNQYLNKGVIFTGYAGSGNPIINDYGASTYGAVLHSDTWYNPLRVNFMDTTTGTHYHLAQTIELDNPINTEIDYMSIDVYDSTNVLIHHQVSTSPQHVVINFGTPSAAYIVLDDSASTAYVVDNILLDYGTTSTAGIKEISQNTFSVFPNPSTGNITIRNENKINEIKVENSLGQIIYHSKTAEKNVSLLLEENGIYFVTVLSGNTTTIRKVVVMK